MEEETHFVLVFNINSDLTPSYTQLLERLNNSNITVVAIHQLEAKKLGIFINLSKQILFQLLYKERYE